METVVRAVMLAALMAATAAVAGAAAESTPDLTATSSTAIIRRPTARSTRPFRSTTCRAVRYRRLRLPCHPDPASRWRILLSRSLHKITTSCSTWRNGARIAVAQKCGLRNDRYPTKKSTSRPRSAEPSSRPPRAVAAYRTSSWARGTFVDSRRKATMRFLRTGSGVFRNRCLSRDYLSIDYLSPCGRGRRAQRVGLSRPSMAFEALGLLSIGRGEGAAGARCSRRKRAAGACCADAHPLPNPSPIKGEGLKRARNAAGSGIPARHE